jgi:hypothetical protein
MPETVDIFKNKKTGLYLVQRKCPDPELNGPTSIGQPEILSEAQLRRLGVRKILDALESSLRPCPDLLQIKHSTKEEHRKFCSAHNCVTIARWPDGAGEVELHPLCRVRGGYRSIPGGKSVLAVEDLQFDLIDEVLSAFELIERQ